MKNIPIIILNKDRLEPLKKLIESLHSRKYYNIIIIDNLSTYAPLLQWYKDSKLEVFYNNHPETKFDTGTFAVLAGKAMYQPNFYLDKFRELTKDYYIFTDSDVVPVDSLPEDFADHMTFICKKYNKHKVGLGLKIDDLPTHQIAAQKAIEKERIYWENKIVDGEFELYPCPIDTTFAVYAPGTVPGWGHDCLRMGGNYTAHHMPWYYDINNLPADEQYYLDNLQYGKGPCYSWEIKTMINK